MEIFNSRPEVLWRSGWSKRATDAYLNAVRWIPSHETITVQGYDLGGMVYVDLRRPARSRAHPYVIASSLSVASNPSIQLRHWPAPEYRLYGYYSRQGYGEMSPECRQAYLLWLATGRSDPQIPLKYVELYMSGLERRMCVDRLEGEELDSLYLEVQRLQSLYGVPMESEAPYISQPIRAFADKLCLVHAILRGGPFPVLEPVLELYKKRAYWKWSPKVLPARLGLALGQRVHAQQPLTSSKMLSWWLSHWNARLDTPSQRAFDEFCQLFHYRFDQGFPNGLAVKPPKKTLTYNYQSFHALFDRDFQHELAWCPDLSRSRKPITLATEIAVQCMADLRPYGRYMGQRTAVRGSLAAHAHLPPPLRTSIPNPNLEVLAAWARPLAESAEPVTVSMLMSKGFGPNFGSPTPARWGIVLDLYALVGLGIAPDPVAHFPVLKENCSAILYSLSENLRQRPKFSSTFCVALATMTLSTFMFQSEGSVSAQQRNWLDVQFEQEPDLTQAERSALRAHLKWMLAMPHRAFRSWRWLSRPEPTSIQQNWHTIVVDAATWDGNPGPDQILAARKLFRIMKKPFEEFYSLVHQRLAVTGSTPLTDLNHASSPSQKAAQARVDTSRVEVIAQETRQVSQALSEVFVKAEAEHARDSGQDAVAFSDPWSELDAAHQILIKEVLTRETWSRAEFSQLVHRCDISLWEGALETINEWAFREFDAPLLVEETDWVLNTEVMQALQQSQGNPI